MTSEKRKMLLVKDRQRANEAFAKVKAKLDGGEVDALVKAELLIAVERLNKLDKMLLQNGLREYIV